MQGRYYYPVEQDGGRWATSRKIGGRTVCLIERTSLDQPEDAETVLRALGIPPSDENLDRYFPKRPGKGRCPTLDLLELSIQLDPTHAAFREGGPDHSGV